MQFNLKLTHKALILIAVPLLFEVVFVALLAWFVVKAEREAERELNSNEIITTADSLYAAAQDAGISLYLYNKTPDQSLLKKYNNNMIRIEEGMKHLAELTAGSEQESKLTAQAVAYAEDGKEIGKFVLDAMLKGEKLESGSRELSPLKIRVFTVLHHLTDVIHKLGRTERAQNEALRERHFRGLVLPLLLIGVAANVIVAFALALFFNSGTTRRLKVLMDNSIRLAAGTPLAEPLHGHDEIAQLDDVFHKMASALAEAQRKERAIVENAIDVICSIDEKLFFKEANSASKDVFGLEPEELIGTKLASLVVSEDMTRTTTEFARLKSDTVTPFFENRLLRKDGAQVDIRWSAHWSDSEKVFYCVASDISARREVERLKQEFVSMMSHDLRTPLMSIQATLSLLSAGACGELPDSAKTNVIDADRNISYIVSLINSLIDVERLDTAKLQIHASPMELQDVLEAAVLAVRSLANNKEIQLQCATSPVELNADGDRILQVLINLLSNAIKFSPRKSTIRVDCVAIDDCVEIQVVDQGRGIPDSQLDAVFDRFKQTRTSDATVQKGSGLGLAICKSIVEAHGGTIGVRSIEGQGSTFWFRLPVAVGIKYGETLPGDQLHSIL